jgi:hypothetical protein
MSGILTYKTDYEVTQVIKYVLLLKLWKSRWNYTHQHRNGSERYYHNDKSDLLQASIIHPFTNNSQRRVSKETKKAIGCRKHSFLERREKCDSSRPVWSPPYQNLLWLRSLLPTLAQRHFKTSLSSAEGSAITLLTLHSKPLLLHCFLPSSKRAYLSRRGNTTERVSLTLPSLRQTVRFRATYWNMLIAAPRLSKTVLQVVAFGDTTHAQCI